MSKVETNESVEKFMKQQQEINRKQAVILDNVIDRLEALENQKDGICSGKSILVQSDVTDQNRGNEPE